MFSCLIEPEHLTHFWGPIGMSTALGNINVDPPTRRSVRDRHGQRHRRQPIPMRATYDEIVEPQRLVWTDLDTGVRTTATFADLGDSRAEIGDRDGLVNHEE